MITENNNAPKGTYTNAKGEVRDIRELSLLTPVDMLNLAHPDNKVTAEEMIQAHLNQGK